VHCICIHIIACERSGKQSGLSGASRKSGGPWSRVEHGGASLAKNDRAGAERGAGVTEIGWSVERLFRRSHSDDPITCSTVIQIPDL